MQATSTPTLSQPKPNALNAFAAAVTLAIGLTSGILVGFNLAPSAGTVAVSGPTGAGLSIQRNGETGALTPAQRSLADQRKGEIAAGAAAPAVTIPSLGGRDPMAYWNGYALSVTDHDLARGAGGWYAFEPIGRSAFGTDAARKVGISHR